MEYFCDGIEEAAIAPAAIPKTATRFHLVDGVASGRRVALDCGCFLSECFFMLMQ